jgi:molecular chaperone DnaK (HSP70)
LPATRTETFYTAYENQTAVNIKIYESRSTDESMEIEDRTPLTEIEMRFTKNVPVSTPVEMTFALDNAGILHIIAEEQRYHSKLDTTFQLSNQMSDAEMNSAALRMSTAKIE